MHPHNYDESSYRAHLQYGSILCAPNNHEEIRESLNEIETPMESLSSRWKKPLVPVSSAMQGQTMGLGNSRSEIVDRASMRTRLYAFRSTLSRSIVTRIGFDTAWKCLFDHDNKKKNNTTEIIFIFVYTSVYSHENALFRIFDVRGRNAFKDQRDLCRGFN